jgi:peptidoglycan-N-acetylglucosamine deacetylase
VFKPKFLLMKRRKKLHLTLAIFLLFAIGAMIFVLFVFGENKNININKEQQEAEIINSKLDKNNNAKPIEGQDENNSDEIIETEGIDWDPVIEKYRGKEIANINTAEKVVALTFDAGANADGVDRVLDILEKENIKGTFFLTGKFIEKYQDKVQKIIASGGDLGNHSYSHPYFTQINDKEIIAELEKTENLLSEFNTKFKPFFRFPYGDRNSFARTTVNNKNYIDIRWTIDSLGWKGTSGGMTKEAVENKVISKTVPGAIIMMHLGSNPDDKTHLDSEALPEIILELKKQGYEFATLTELLDVNNF